MIRDKNLKSKIAAEEERNDRHEEHVKSCLKKMGLHEHSSQADKRIVRNVRRENKRILKNQRKKAVKKTGHMRIHKLIKPAKYYH